MRIIAGTKRGQAIAAPKGRETRPTLDRVRESLFGIIQFEVAGKTVLDLFAGSGSLGLEALSRGAEYAVFNDAARESVAIVRFRFGLVFLDPPYRAGLLEETLVCLKTAGVLAPGCRVIAEHAANLPPETPEGFVLADRRKYGIAGLSIFEEEPA